MHRDAISMSRAAAAFYNGDLGVVARIDMEEGELHVDFDGREVTYGFGELDELILAHATSMGLCRPSAKWP
jgi:ATP-dependent exoDNAse (exonuclease V) alpha subunit